MGLRSAARSSGMPWYQGPTLLQHLEEAPVNDARMLDQPFRMAVQWVNRPTLDFRGFAGVARQCEVQRKKVELICGLHAVGPCGSDGGLNLGAGPDRYGAFAHDDLVVGHLPADVAGGGEHVFQVGRSVLIRRGADSDELDGPVFDGLVDIRCEM